MPKKDFTSFDAAIAIHELADTLSNSKVNNVYQLNEKTLLLKLHKTDKPPFRLTLEAGRRLHLTAYALEKPKSPPAFCMALRKYLRNSWLMSIDQYEFERIAAFTFKTKIGMLSLVLELFGEGNIILTSEKGEILQAMIYKRMRDRNIVRGEIYNFPPESGKNPFKITRENLPRTLEEAGAVEVVRTLARSLSLGGVYAEETLLRAGIEKSRLCTSLNENEIESIYVNLQTLLSYVSVFRIEPRIVLDEAENFVDVIPFKLKRYENHKSQAYPSFNEALDEFYLRVTAAEKAIEITSGTDELQRKTDKLNRVIAEQIQALREAEHTAEKDKQIGNIIYAHSTEIQALLDKFNDAKLRGRVWDAVVFETLAGKVAGKAAESLFESFDPRNLAININVDNMRFSIEIRKTLFENAAEFYERGKKAKQKAAGAMVALEKSQQKIAEAKESLREAEAIKVTKPAELMKDFTKRKIERKEWFEKFRWFKSSEGFLVVAGKDAVSNEVLIKKHTEKADPVFHADISGAPFVVIKAEGEIPSVQTLTEASEFAASHSRAWREGLGAVDVYWVTPQQLSKTGPSGEYVAHGAFAVQGKRNWMRGVSLKVAVGVVHDKDEVLFVGGPVDSVKTLTKAYVVVEPGDVMGKELLKKILQSLSTKLPREHRVKVARASIELIREFVPYTKGRITETPW